MFTNEIKAGTRIQMKNGWYGTMMDNGKGNTRVAKIEGNFTETGSVYAHDIFGVLVNDVWDVVEYTPAQLKMKSDIDGIFGV